MLCMSSILCARSDSGSKLSPVPPIFVSDCWFQKEEERERKGRGQRKKGGREGKRKQRETDLMLMQCGISNSRMNQGIKSFNSADLARYSKNEIMCLTGTCNAEYGSQLAFAFSPLQGLTAILIPDCALLAACFVMGPLLFT